MNSMAALKSPPSLWPKHIAEALAMPNGARFYKAALQVNPFEYLARHGKKTSHKDETSYNYALVDACKKHHIEVIAVTDHYRIRSGENLIADAVAAGIQVFPGFEAATSDGIHFLCLFEIGRDLREIERIIGDCGIHDDKKPSPIGKLTSVQLIEECQRSWGGLCVAAHVIADSGILHSLQGQPRMAAWKHPHLLACSIAGAASSTPQDKRHILENKNPDYRRERAVTILNSQDVSDPNDLADASSTCWIKMSMVSLQGLRLAFLDPESRIRLATDPPPEEHTEFLAMTWQSGFLDGVRIHFNGNLNALIGGRGTGKSTVVESIRFVLDAKPLGDEAQKQFDGFLKSVLKSGTTVSLLVRSHYPATSTYLIERTVAGSLVVRDHAGKVLNLLPRDIVPQAEVFGQHEISELTKSPDKLTQLLQRFVERDPTLLGRKANVRKQLEESRNDVLKSLREIKRLDEQLSKLPALEETQKRYKESGVSETLREQSAVVRENATLKTLEAKMEPLSDALSAVAELLPVEPSELDNDEVKALPGYQTIDKARSIFTNLTAQIAASKKAIEDAIEQATDSLAVVRKEWAIRQKRVQSEYDRILRELQKQKIDGNEFIALETTIADLRPLANTLAETRKKLGALATDRRNHLASWEDIKSQEFREVDNAAKKVNRQLTNRVLVDVTYAANRKPLHDLLRMLPGRLAESIETLVNLEALSLSELAAACRAGREALSEKYGIPKNQADAIAVAGEDLFMKIEELDLPATTAIKLNIAQEGKPTVWKKLPDLSTGQKATAVLLLLLLESEGPLIVDQPEDDLDNRFITDGIVPKMRDEKRRRQFIFATHNANIPVLGDAELILGLAASGEADAGRAQLPIEHMASIDSHPVRELVEEILEGGKAAFEMRRLKYGF